MQETVFRHHRFFSMNTEHMEMCLDGKVLHFEIHMVKRMKRPLLLVPVRATIARHHGEEESEGDRLEGNSNALGLISSNHLNGLGMWSDEYDWFDPNSWLVI